MTNLAIITRLKLLKGEKRGDHYQERKGLHVSSSPRLPCLSVLSICRIQRVSIEHGTEMGTTKAKYLHSFVICFKNWMKCNAHICSYLGSSSATRMCSCILSALTLSPVIGETSHWSEGSAEGAGPLAEGAFILEALRGS